MTGKRGQLGQKGFWPRSGDWERHTQGLSRGWVTSAHPYLPRPPPEPDQHTDASFSEFLAFELPKTHFLRPTSWQFKSFSWETLGWEGWGQGC